MKLMRKCDSLFGKVFQFMIIFDLISEVDGRGGTFVGISKQNISLSC